MSIDANGSLAGVTLISSSGYADLDDGAINVVRAAAPFEPLPEIYNLSLALAYIRLPFSINLRIRPSPCPKFAFCSN